MKNCIWFLYMTVLTCFTCDPVKCVPVVQEVRLTLTDTASGYSRYEPAGPGTYAFGYDIDEPETQNTQFRDEERHSNGTVTGRYGWVAPDGNVYMVNYIADKRGYRSFLKYIHCLSLTENVRIDNGRTLSFIYMITESGYPSDPYNVHGLSGYVLDKVWTYIGCLVLSGKCFDTS